MGWVIAAGATWVVLCALLWVLCRAAARGDRLTRWRRAPVVPIAAARRLRHRRPGAPRRPLS